MALIKCNYKSSALEKATEFLVILPDNKKALKLRVLYLLHGLSDDSTAWQRYTSIERYLRYNTDTMVVMPDGDKSFYTDMAYGGKYYTYITEELPKYIQAVFNVSDRREDTYIAGLSMGGYGAMKIALANPEKYSAAASFSGALDAMALMRNGADLREDVKAIVGERTAIEESNENLFYLLDKEFKVKPKILQMCGTEDFLYRDNQKFKAVIGNKGFEYEYREGPGSHTWDYWDECIRYALEFFGIENE